MDSTQALVKTLRATTRAGLMQRMRALGQLVPCRRCHGSGSFSFNTTDGDRCYGCNGSGDVLPRLTAERLATIAELVAKGGLDAYEARQRSIKAARAALAPAIERADAIYKTVADAYEVAYRSNAITDFIRELQEANNDAYWGMSTGRGSQHPALPGVCGVEGMLRRGVIAADTALALVELQTARLERIRDMYLAG